MKKILPILALVLLSQLSFATTVGVDIAKTVGYNFLVQHGNTALSRAEDLRLVYTSGSLPACFYAFSGGNCFVLVSADDAVNPVLAYSNDQVFSGNNPPPNISGFLGNYNTQINYIISNNLSASAEQQRQWHDLIHNVKAPAARTTATPVAPLLTTTWSQDTGYNDLCPHDAAVTGAGHRVPTGCNATAMAQIMKYWNWPGHGSGSHSYTTSGYGSQSVDFSATNYDWAAMPDHGPSSAIATLMYHAGVAINMAYAPGGSSSNVNGSDPSSEYALKNYFCYLSSIESIFRSNFNDASWISAITSELDNRRLVLYTGQGSIGGHAWVVDGYDASNYLHCNWGWGGSDNGYYLTNNMIPGPNANGDYNNQQTALIHIHPGAPDAAIWGASNVCIGYQAGLSAIPSNSGGDWSSADPSIATVNSLGVVSGVSAGSVLIKFAVPAGCGNHLALFRINVRNGAVRVVNSVASTGINSPYGVAVDGSGNVYFSDANNNQVKKISSGGAISVVAGSGTSGFGGDGAAAVSAKLNAPSGVALDGAGNLYIADKNNNRVRKVNTSGIITTVAGKGIASTGGDGGAATAATINNPVWIAVTSSGILYISDDGRIRKVNTSGTISTYAGNGLVGTGGGEGGPATAVGVGSTATLAVDASGNLYFGALYSRTVRKVNSSGIVSTVAGIDGVWGISGDGGPATAATLNDATGLAVDGPGNIYITDRESHTLRIVNTSGIITTIAGDGTAAYAGDGGDPLVASFNIPLGLAVSSTGNIFIADNNNNRIREISDSTVDCVALNTPVVPVAANRFKLYPNPNIGSFSVDIPGQGSDVSINIIDLSGRAVNFKQSANGSKNIDIELATTTPGIYIVRVRAGNNVYREKVLVH